MSEIAKERGVTIGVISRQIKSAKKKKFINDDLNELITICNTTRSLKIEYNKIKLNNLGGLK